MDIDEVRRQNIRILEREVGMPKVMAELVGMSYAQYANTRDGAKEAKTGKKRGMRKETAWRFEDACKKPRGWLDQVHSQVGSDNGKPIGEVPRKKPTESEAVLAALRNWRMHASPRSLQVIDRLTRMAEKEALREEDWTLIDQLAKRLKQAS